MLVEPTPRSDVLAGQVARRHARSRGIDSGTSTMLAANRARMVIADVDGIKADETVPALNAEFRDNTTSASVADLVAPDTCDALVQRTLDTYGGLDIVVNNAGSAWDGGIHDISDEQFQAVLDVHLVVPFRLAQRPRGFQAQAEDNDPHGMKRHRKTVMVPSLAGQWRLVGAGNYASAQAGMLGLMRTLAQECGRFQVNVNAVAFSVVRIRFGLPQVEHEVIEAGGRRSREHADQTRPAHDVTIDPHRVVPDEEMYTARPMPSHIVPLGRTGRSAMSRRDLLAVLSTVRIPPGQ